LLAAERDIVRPPRIDKLKSVDRRRLAVARIQVRVEAYILALFPQSISPAPRAPGSPAPSAELRAIALGLAVPSFWTRHQITQAFDAANEIWRREADIEFAPLTISERMEAVPANERDMWIHFVNHLAPQARGISVGFVYDLPSDEGGWGGGRIAVISGEKAAEGLSGFAGNLLAHELGHVLIDDPLHGYAGDNPSNLMYGRRNPRVANAGLLNQRQVDLARTRALGI
jgi:hypothetical protein